MVLRNEVMVNMAQPSAVVTKHIRKDHALKLHPERNASKI